MLNKKKKKSLVLRDINIDLNPENVKPASSDYIPLLQSNAFFAIVTSPPKLLQLLKLLLTIFLQTVTNQS